MLRQCDEDLREAENDHSDEAVTARQDLDEKSNIQREPSPSRIPDDTARLTATVLYLARKMQEMEERMERYENRVDNTAQTKERTCFHTVITAAKQFWGSFQFQRKRVETQGQPSANAADLPVGERDRSPSPPNFGGPLEQMPKQKMS